ncbi:MAG: hypothetical protein Q9181_006736 [Wetmoreana brouardii]
MSLSTSPTSASPVGSAPKNLRFTENIASIQSTGFSSVYNESVEPTFSSSQRTTQTETEEDEEEDKEEDDIPTADPPIAAIDEDSPWAKKYTLSLDGGGVRGYSSLLLLKRLMEEIAILEKEDNKASTSAFSPFIDETSPDSDPIMKKLENTYWPCHYFDYVGGSSTGGLIAIMLGRLRMTVDECLGAYEDLSANVFEKPSSRLMRSWSKHNTSTERETLKELFERLQPAQPSPNEQKVKFKSDAVKCRTIVYSNRSDRKGKNSAPYVFRSYECNESEPREFAIWEVAKATSAVPSYFKSTTLYGHRYSDAAINMSNPSQEVYKEVGLLNKAHESVELLLSLGTGNTNGNIRRPKHSLPKELNDVSDIVHREIVDASKQAAFDYYRWDVQGGLEDVSLDEWKPSSSGKRTLTRIARATNRYLEDVNVRKQIRDCAATLVRSRMLRAQTMRWESHTSGTRYECPIPACDYRSQRFQNRNELMDHLQTVHGKPPPDAIKFPEIETQIILLDPARLRIYITAYAQLEGLRYGKDFITHPLPKFRSIIEVGEKTAPIAMVDLRLLGWITRARRWKGDFPMLYVLMGPSHTIRTKV